MESTYKVEGMSCGHCVTAVTGELKEVGGVTGVAVDLEGGLVTVTSEKELELDTVREAIDEAGYELKGKAVDQAKAEGGSCCGGSSCG
ncbi:heavy-metal-associated domain-containing protein [Salininema proteolyticum]|uniref:Heavy-metal-associated domain-containing protein n=1 Tax=Salininema proteolyticum TaxID=1607685 RepID=A0ABV8U244_9ACTN